MNTKDTCHQVHDSSSSVPTVVSLRCESILELGRKLTKEFDLDQSVDTLGRWMTHYIAELMQEAENATVEDKPTKLARCADAILKLWDHRHGLPDGKRPFQDLEPILRALESLDPCNEEPRYYSQISSALDNSTENSETRNWFKLIDSVDYTAKLLIRYFLSQASLTAVDKTKSWVHIAKSAGVKEEAEIPVVRFIKDELKFVISNDPDEKELERLKERINHLENFMQLTGSVLSDLREKLNRIEKE